MKRIIVITGTPCSGKTTVSKRLAKSMKDSELISANDLVKSKKLYTSRAREGELIVNMGRLRAEVIKRARQSDADVVIIEGHIMCDMTIPGATAVVVREHLKTLLGRLKERGYSKKKIEGNIVSEAIDYCGVHAAENYVHVHEVMGGKGAVREIMQALRSNRSRKADIDMLGELDGMAKALGKRVL